MIELADQVMRTLPSLRRYARAVRGEREQGDADVVACLRLVGKADPGAREAIGDPRLLLYRTLHAVWALPRHFVPEREPSPSRLENGAIVAARVGSLSPLKRQALFLTALEGFAVDEAAQVMGLVVDEVEGLLRQARAELRWQKSCRILIIEDEPIIALDIASTIQRCGHTVVGIAATRREAVAVARREAPELILADIHLADDSSGIDAVHDIVADGTLPVVFLTAFPDRLVQEIRPEPTFLITKPFDAETLRLSISQALASGTIRGQAYLQ